MKCLKKLTAIILSLFLFCGAIFLPKTEVSAEKSEQVTKKIELLDLSGYENGTVLIKNETVLPYNIEWGQRDDYNAGKREVVNTGSAIKVNYPTEDGGSPLLKLNGSFRQSALSDKNGVAMWINTSSAGTLRFVDSCDCYIDGSAEKQWKEIMCEVKVEKGEQYVYFPFESFTLKDKADEKVTEIINVFYEPQIVFRYLDDSRGTVYIDKLGLYGDDKSITVFEDFNSSENVKQNWLITSEIVDDVTAEGDQRALKLNFNEPVEEKSNRQLGNVENYELTFNIPEAYRPYIKSVNTEFDNQSVNGSDIWNNTNLNYLLGITDGESYGKNVDQTTRVLGLGEKSVTENITDLWKISGWYYTYAYDNTSNFVKWSDEDKASISTVLLAVTVPAGAATDTYVLIKSVSITVEGTAEQLAAAERTAEEESVLIADFENGTLDCLHNPGDSSNSVQINDPNGGIYTANGNYALKVTRPQSKYNGDMKLKLDKRNAFYDGVSFYVYNPNETAYDAYCFIGNSTDLNDCYAQKVVSIKSSGDYLKYTVWFDDLGAFSDRLQNGESHGTALTEAKRKAADFLEIRLPYAPEGTVFYFDYFCYEKHTGRSELALELSKASFAADNGYSDTETPTVAESGIIYSVDGTKDTSKTEEDLTYQGWMTSFDVTGKMTNADGVKLSLKNNSQNEVKVLAVLYESAESTWKWGANPLSLTLEAGQTLTEELLYSGDIHKDTSYQLHHWISNKAAPANEENERIKELRIYVWSPDNAVEGGTVELNGVSILYGKSRLNSSMKNGKIELSSNGFYHSAGGDTDKLYENEKSVINIIPDDGYMLVPGSVTAKDSLGNSVEITREGFRKLNSAHTWSFTAGKEDITVSASFAPQNEVLAKIYGGSVLNSDGDIQFDYTVPLKNGRVAAENGELYEAVGFGVLLTADDVLEKYGLNDGLTVELIENGSFVGELSTNIHITEAVGAFYDYTTYAASFSAVVKDIPEKLMDKAIVARAYVEYYNSNGTLCRNYDSTQLTAVFNDMYRDGWSMTFSDSFDGTDINSLKWQALDKLLINDNSKMSCEADMVSVENGMLKLSAVKETHTAFTYGGEEKTVDYKVGRLETRGLFEQKYGRFEARIKYDEEDTICPAFWMMPDSAYGLQGENDGKGAEIDIMEHIKGLIDSNTGNDYCTSSIHWGGYGENHHSKSFYPSLSSPWNWHTYALEWDENEYRFYIDGELRSTFAGEEVENLSGNGIAECPEYLILSLSVGDWSNESIDDDKLPGNMYVDWVHVYEKA